MSNSKITKNQILALLVVLALMVIGTIGNISATTLGGAVKVRRVTFCDDSGRIVSGQLYIPKTATVETPAPAVLTNHGGGASSEAQSSYNIELSRRGFVVLSWDASNSGSSEASPDATHGGEAAYDFVQSLDFVQKDQLAASGHSMGGVYSYMIAQNHPENIRLEVALGMNPGMNDVEVFETNYACIIGDNDESSLVRCGGDIMNLMTNEKYLTLFGLSEGEAVVPGQLYGDFAAGTGRVFYVPHSSHAGGMINTEYIQVYLDTVQSVLAAPNPIAGSDQVWMYKDFAMAAQFAGLIGFMFCLASLLLKSAAFAGLILPERKAVGFPAKSPAWWVAILAVMFVPSLLFIWGTTRAQVIDFTSFMKLDNTANGVAVWSLISACALLAIFFVYHFLYGKKHGGSLMTYGLATQPDENRVTLPYIAKAFGFAAVVIGGTYLAYSLMYTATCGDIHIWLATLRPVTLIRLPYFPLYFLLQFPFYLTGTLCGRSFSLNNGERSKGAGMRNSLLLSLLIGILGLSVIFIVFNIAFRTSGTVLFPANRGYIYAGAIFSMLPAFAVGNTINCYVTNKTNSIYAGLFSGVLWSTWVVIAANALA